MFKKSVLLITFSLGVTMMTPSVSAEELKPSQLKSLNNTLKKIDQTKGILEEDWASAILDDIKARDRQLKKIQKSLGRLTKSLERLPSHSDADKGLDEIKYLESLANQKLKEVEQQQQKMIANQADADVQFRQMMAADSTQQDIKRMDDLTESFRTLVAYLSATNGGLTHFIYKSVNEPLIADAVTLIKNADHLVAESDRLNKQYAPYITRSGAMSLPFSLKGMTTAQQKYLSTRPEFIALFPDIQKRAVENLNTQLDEIMKTHYNKDMFSENSSNKTSIQLDKAKVVVQAKIFEAVVGAEAHQVVKMKNESMAYWEKVKNETDYNIYLKSKEDHHNKSWLTDDSTNNTDHN